MARQENWPGRLDAAIAVARHQPFQWGHHDCVLFAVAIIEAITGVDYSDGIRGTYETASGAMKALRKRGYRSAAEAATGTFGEPINKWHAQRGDLLLHSDAIGICVGIQGAFVTAAGLGFVTVADCQMAWRVD